MKRDRQLHCYHGFTLVELLVVIGIIALLIAILMPALSSVRRSANALRCSSNLRSLGQILLLHAGDHAGYMPLAGNISPGSTTNGPDHPRSLGDVSQRRYVYYENTPGVFCVTAMPTETPPWCREYSVCRRTRGSADHFTHGQHGGGRSPRFAGE